MTYAELQEHLDEMTDEQLEMAVVFADAGQWLFPSALLFVKKDHSEDGFLPNQPILAG